LGTQTSEFLIQPKADWHSDLEGASFRLERLRLVYGRWRILCSDQLRGDDAMNNTAITSSQARAEPEHRTDSTSSQKGYAMNQSKVISKSCFVLAGIALAVALASCGQTVPVPDVPDQAVLEQTVQAPSEVNAQPILKTASISDGLVGYWPFDETGLSKTDLSVNHNTMNFSNGLLAEATTPKLALPNPSALSFPSNYNVHGTAPGKGIDDLQNFTLSFWVRFPTNSSLLGQHNLVSINGKVEITYGYGSNNLPTLLFANSDKFTMASAKLADGAYHHVIGTRDGRSIRLYVDGYNVSSQSNLGTLAQGHGITVADVTKPFTGNIDDLRIYNRTLSPEEVQDWYVCGRGLNIPASECHALVAFYNTWSASIPSSPNAAAILASGWAHTTTPCTWYGVSCLFNPVERSDIHVDHVDLNGSRLVNTAPLPKELKDLAQLQVLDLSRNLFNGPIPEQLENLHDLVTLNLSENRLSGQIPILYGNLQTLNLSKNQLSGPIQNLTMGHLITLNLAGNQLSGEMPSSLPASSTLTAVHLENNQLSGPIPRFQRLNANPFKEMGLAYNKLSSTEPYSVLLLQSLTSGWETTQTMPATNMQAKVISDSSVTLTWTPVQYPQNGYYDILFTTAGGTTKSAGHTANQSSSSFTVNGLATNRNYSFVVRTVTPKHDLQQSNLTSDSATSATVTVIVNHAPYAANDSYAVTKDTPLSVNAARGIFANDNDPDGNVFKVASITTVAVGNTLALNPDGSFSFTPATGFVGTATFTYQITDGTLVSNMATISFQVTPAQPGSVGLIVYQEMNFNGTWDFNEDILPGWTVTAKNNQTGQTQTLLSGASLVPARFANLMPGSYTVCQTTKPGWTSLSGDSSAGCYTRNLSAGQNLVLWFGNKAP
jgi:Concanavalin A-like lectin/glucanases superfamily/Bacterial Ig domain/Leucine rich repeat N-terminal domain